MTWIQMILGIKIITPVQSYLQIFTQTNRQKNIISVAFLLNMMLLKNFPKQFSTEHIHNTVSTLNSKVRQIKLILYPILDKGCDTVHIK